MEDAYLDDFINHRAFSAHTYKHTHWQQNYINSGHSPETYRLSNYCIQVLITLSNLKSGGIVLAANYLESLLSLQLQT